MRTSARQPDTDHSQPKDIITKPKPLLITLAAVSALAASAANAAQVVVTTGASYVKMVDALAALYQKETGVAVETSFGGNISERTNTLSLEIFNAVSHADFDAANALCLLLSLFAAVIFLAAELLIRRSPRL